MFRFYLLIKCSRGLGLALAIALGSRWVCAAMACAKCAGKSKHNLLKNAKGRLYYFLVCPRLIFQSQSYLRSRSLVHVGNFCVKIVFRCFLKHKFVRALLLPTCVFLLWCASEAASCPRNQTWNEDKDYNLHVTAP